MKIVRQQGTLFKSFPTRKQSCVQLIHLAHSFQVHGILCLLPHRPTIYNSDSFSSTARAIFPSPSPSSSHIITSLIVTRSLFTTTGNLFICFTILLRKLNSDIIAYSQLTSLPTISQCCGLLSVPNTFA